jgi:3-oxoacyl-[acyl-carrier protein] reductase
MRGAAAGYKHGPGRPLRCARLSPLLRASEEMHMFDFSGRRALVMGGSRGIGRAIALGFARAGARVAICARGQASLDATRAELGEGAFAAPCDLADPAAIAHFIPEAATALGGIDILVNNASGFGSEDDEEGWAASFQVDIMAIVRASHAAEPFLAEAAPRLQGGSSIVNVSSISALRAAARSLPYGAAKAAVDHYTSSQARVLGRKQIRVNGVAPGSIEFPDGRWEERRLQGSPVYQSVLASMPQGRLGVPEEVADVVLFLASPAARWVTGQTLAVDGGQLLGL